MLKYLLHTKKRIKLGHGSSYPMPRAKEFLVLYMIEPTPDEEAKVADDFKLDLNVLKNYPKEPTTKTFSTDPLQLVFGDYYLDEHDEVRYIRVLITVTADALIITLPAKAKHYVDFFDGIPVLLKSNGDDVTIGHILYEFLDDHTQDNYDILRKTEEKIIKVEQQVLNFESKHSINVNEIVNLKRDLFRMSRRFWSTAKIIFLLKKRLTSVAITDKTLKLLDDVYDTYQHQLDILASQREMISDIINIYSTSINNKLARTSNDLNTVMKKLTSFTVIIMVPTLIASMYGMNFKYLPAATADYGFFEISALMVVLSLVFYYYFHKKDWI
ncbi:magnesium transporter CorA family protein [Candidatus Woesearchaeota archaeon]|nr:magnesium transporter CorA family protein [Candidatus Woesearchaeota archaeon]